MQSKDHCTYGCTTLYELSIWCVVCNTESELFCETLAEWVMFEADLWNIDSLSSTICSVRALISDSSKIAFQHQCCQENPSLRFKSTGKFLQVSTDVYIYNGWRRKVDRKGASDGRIS